MLCRCWTCLRKNCALKRPALLAHSLLPINQQLNALATWDDV